MACVRCLALATLLSTPNVLADVFVYEADSFPEESGWDIVQIFCDPELWVEGGWFFQHVELCPGVPPPGGQTAGYRRYLDDFLGEGEFFIEWVVESDADQSEIPWGGGAAFAAASSGPVRYTFFITRDLVKLNRDNTLPIVFVEIEPGVPHTYRLELYGADLYVWYIDGEVADSGLPEAAYPSYTPFITWRASAAFLPDTTGWDYIRYGTIPAEGSGDFDSDGEVDFDDWPFFQECFSTDAGSWPGCAWADMDFDGDTDCDDWSLFLKAWTDPADPPPLPECENPADFNGDGSVGPFDLAILLGAWGPCPKPCTPGPPVQTCVADLSGDCIVGPFDLATLLGNWG